MAKYEFNVVGFEGVFEVEVNKNPGEYRARTFYFKTGYGPSLYFEHDLRELVSEQILNDLKGMVITYIRDYWKKEVRPEDITIVSPVKKEEKKMFKVQDAEIRNVIGQTIAYMMWANNSETFASQSGVYGGFKMAIEQFAVKLSGLTLEEVKSIDDWNWGGNGHYYIEDFEIAIQEKLDEIAHEKKAKRARKMVEVIEEHHHIAFYSDGDYIEAISGTPDTWDENEIEKIPLSWDEVYKWLGY